LAQEIKKFRLAVVQLERQANRLTRIEKRLDYISVTLEKIEENQKKPIYSKPSYNNYNNSVLHRFHNHLSFPL